MQISQMKLCNYKLRRKWVHYYYPFQNSHSNMTFNIMKINIQWVLVTWDNMKNKKQILQCRNISKFQKNKSEKEEKSIFVTQAFRLSEMVRLCNCFPNLSEKNLPILTGEQSWTQNTISAFLFLPYRTL
jgi:hypothetical protein